MIPDQFAHNLTVFYGIQKGRCNLSFECRNFLLGASLPLTGYYIWLKHLLKKKEHHQA